MREPYLRRKPPKSAGREQFGQEYVQVARVGQATSLPARRSGAHSQVFTSLSIADAFRRFIMPRVKVDELYHRRRRAQSLIVAQFAAAIPGVEVVPAGRFGVPVEAKEAFAFAILAYETYHRSANRLPSATGARAVILGKIAYARPLEPHE